MTDLLLALVTALLVGGFVSAIVALRRLRASLARRFAAIDTALDVAHARLTSLSEPSTPEPVLAELARLEAVITALAAQQQQIIRECTAPLRAGKQSVEQRTRRAVAHDVHALLGLHAALPLGAESLPLTGYTADPGTLAHLTTLVAELPDGALIVELGSGLSTVWMAAAARREDRGLRILSIDHDARWGDHTRAALARLGLDAVAEVRIAPLVALPDADAEAAPWYDLTALCDAQAIALLVVDGPPRNAGPSVRAPALPRLVDRLTTEAVVVLDDTDRAEEAAIVQEWVAQLEGVRAVGVESMLDRTTVLRLGPTDAGAPAR